MCFFSTFEILYSLFDIRFFRVSSSIKPTTPAAAGLPALRSLEGEGETPASSIQQPLSSIQDPAPASQPNKLANA